jgi:hypothetical protein
MLIIFSLQFRLLIDIQKKRVLEVETHNSLKYEVTSSTALMGQTPDNRHGASLPKKVFLFTFYTLYVYYIYIFTRSIDIFHIFYIDICKISLVVPRNVVPQMHIKWWWISSIVGDRV